jgi:murein L,D-transpeptidase YcbB/YkuD
MSNILQYINIAVKALSQRDKIEQIIKEATPLIDKATPIVQEVLQKWPKLSPIIKDVAGTVFPNLGGGTTTPGTPQTPTVTFDVRWLQDALNQLGFGPVDVDGVMGPQTHDAIKKFQEAHGLTPDGWAGMQTIPAIYAELQKLQKK